MRMIKVLLLLLIPAFLLNAQTTIKFATLAPDGSTWMNLMNDYAAAVQEATGGKVKFKIFSGGVAGDELVVLRKIRVGQLHSAGFTGVGLGEILPEVRILDAPFLFKNYDEVDHITSTLFDYFDQKFEEQGYVLLGWAEVGFVYVFTNKAINGIGDMDGVKMWMWEGDPIAEATFKSMGLSPIPLSITDVMTSLQTGLINGVYVSPLACTALQWHTKVSHMLKLPLADSNGAVLLSKKVFDKLSTDEQQTLRKLSREYFSRLTKLSREDNARSLELIGKAGITFTNITDSGQLTKFDQAGAKARRDLIGKLYDQAFLDRVEKELAAYRAGKK
jgi:TRAP-type C4-dicarboxylate transport system substrate-binding protein